MVASNLVLRYYKVRELDVKVINLVDCEEFIFKVKSIII